jgi:ribA/ribD-fused uncharacterized protein
MPEVIDSFSGKYECFSNFSAHPTPYIVLGDTILFKTSEHAFQAAKATNKRDRDYVADANTAASAKWRGKRIQLRDGWNDNDGELKNRTMLYIVYNKFSQNVGIGDILVATESARLIEGNYHGDDYWGMVRDASGKWWQGRNQLGLTLELVRVILGKR